eukprot:1261815-Rhodomonas_salina.2
MSGTDMRYAAARDLECGSLSPDKAFIGLESRAWSLGFRMEVPHPLVFQIFLPSYCSHRTWSELTRTASDLLGANSHRFGPGRS